MMIRHLWFSLLMIAPSLLAQVYEVGLVAGNPSQGGSLVDGSISPSVARFAAPTGIAVNPAGRLFVVEPGSTALRMVSLVGNGTVSSLATGFSSPHGVAVQPGGSIFVADTLNHQVKKVLSDDANPPVTVVAGSGFAGTADVPAEFDSPRGISIASANASFAYVCDTNNHTVRKVNLTTGEVTTIAGQAGVSGTKDGNGAAARFNLPAAVAVTSDETIYVADTGNHAIRRISSTGVVTTLAGEKSMSGYRDKAAGTTAPARFRSPWGIALDAAGSLFVCDSGNHVIRKVTTAGVVSTVAGKPGEPGFKNATSGRQAQFNTPRGICRGQVGTTDVFYIADSGNRSIRSMNPGIPGPTITLHPIGQTVAVGGTAIFKVTATRPAGTLPLVYLWRKDGVDLPGETASTLQVTDTQAADQGAYSVIVAVPGGEAVVSHPAPLVIKGKQTWLWASRTGSAGTDAIQGLALRENTTRGTVLWSSGLGPGHVLKRLSPITGLPTATVSIASKGDGAHAVAIDSEGGVFGGMDRGVIQDSYGLLTRHNALGARLWSLDMGRRVVPSTTIAVTDVLCVAIGGDNKPRLGGEFSGAVTFPSRGATAGTPALTLGSSTRARKSGFVSLVDRDGKVEWVREIYGMANDRGDSRISGVVCAADGSVYACGRIGPNGRVMRSAVVSDVEVLSTTEDSAPLLLKFDATGTLLWMHVAAGNGEFVSVSLDASGNPWVTGHFASPLTAVLRRLNPVTGMQEDEVLAGNGRGASVAIHTTLGPAWLVADPAGLLNVLGRSFPAISGYRVIKLNSATLLPDWDLPVFGSLAALPISDQADLAYAVDGRLYASLNFLEEDRPRTVVDFVGRGQLSMKGRKADGFVAIISELPEVGTHPVSQLLARGANATFSVASVGSLVPEFQWYKATAPLSGKTSSQLQLFNIQMTTAGAYSVKVKNGRDVVSSMVAQLGVVDTTPKTVNKASNSSVTFTQSVGGSGLSYQWHKDGSPLSDIPGRIAGSGKRTLTLSKLTTADNGSYVCRVMSSFTSTDMDGGIMTLTVTP